MEILRIHQRVEVRQDSGRHQIVADRSQENDLPLQPAMILRRGCIAGEKLVFSSTKLTRSSDIIETAVNNGTSGEAPPGHYWQCCVN